MAEKIAHQAFLNNLVEGIKIKDIDTQKTFLNSRFDFYGHTHDNKEFICEVKSVPLADYVDGTAKEKAEMDITDKKWNEKIAYFPDGYRKSINEPISERAIKHVKTSDSKRS